MKMITLICCLFTLSSTTFGRSVYDNSYGYTASMGGLTNQYQQPLLAQLPSQSKIPVQSGHGQQQLPLMAQHPSQSQIPVQLGHGQQQSLFSQQPQQQTISSTYGSSHGIQQVPQQAQVIAGRTVVPQLFRSFQTQTPIQQSAIVGLQSQGLSQQNIQQPEIITVADSLCYDKQPGTLIKLADSRFVQCINNGKGVEKQCPKGLVFYTHLSRCDKSHLPSDPCSLKPCLNGGQCIRTDVSTYQCQCAPGFAGQNCELDAHVCQTQQPCGQLPNTKCQSFEPEAALKYICIFEDGQAYGLSAQQVQANPCGENSELQSLAVSDKGYIMCNGPLMFIKSCGANTVWNDVEKVCVTPRSTLILESADQSSQRILPSFAQKAVNQMLPASLLLDRQPLLQTKFQEGLVSEGRPQNPCLTAQGRHPDPSSANRFIECVGTSMVFKSCPGGEVWNNNIKMCSSPTPKSPLDSLSKKKPATGFILQPPETPTQLIHPEISTEKPPVFQQSQVISSQNPCLTAQGRHPDPSSDKGFIECVGTSMVFKSCLGGEVWNNNIKMCSSPTPKSPLDRLPKKKPATGFILSPPETPTQLIYPEISTEKTPVFQHSQVISSQNQIPVSSYGSESFIQKRPVFDQTRHPSSYGQTSAQSYGSQSFFQQQPQLIQQHQQMPFPQNSVVWQQPILGQQSSGY
jgi:hypothetical protein